MEHHTSPTLVCDKSDTPEKLISRPRALRPTTLPDEMTSRLLTALPSSASLHSQRGTEAPVPVHRCWYNVTEKTQARCLPVSFCLS